MGRKQTIANVAEDAGAVTDEVLRGTPEIPSKRTRRRQRVIPPIASPTATPSIIVATPSPRHPA